MNYQKANKVIMELLTNKIETTPIKKEEVIPIAKYIASIPYVEWLIVIHYANNSYSLLQIVTMLSIIKEDKYKVYLTKEKYDSLKDVLDDLRLAYLKIKIKEGVKMLANNPDFTKTEGTIARSDTNANGMGETKIYTDAEKNSLSVDRPQTDLQRDIYSLPNDKLLSVDLFDNLNSSNGKSDDNE